MTAPKRIQLRRTTGWRKPEGAIVVARPSRWGNPFAVGGPSGLARTPAIHHPDRPWEYEGRISAAGMRHDYHHGDGRVTEVHVRAMTRAEVVECYRAYITGGGWPIDWKPRGAPTLDDIRRALAGHDLACWCPLDQPCHADVLLEIANLSVAQGRDDRRGRTEGKAGADERQVQTGRAQRGVEVEEHTHGLTHVAVSDRRAAPLRDESPTPIGLSSSARVEPQNSADRQSGAEHPQHGNEQLHDSNLPPVPPTATGVERA